MNLLHWVSFKLLQEWKPHPTIGPTIRLNPNQTAYFKDLLILKKDLLILGIVTFLVCFWSGVFLLMFRVPGLVAWWPGTFPLKPCDSWSHGSHHSIQRGWEPWFLRDNFRVFFVGFVCWSLKFLMAGGWWLAFFARSGISKALLSQHLGRRWIRLGCFLGDMVGKEKSKPSGKMG